MLVLSRKTDESIRIADQVTITILKIRGNSIQIGIEAPRDVRVLRGELQRRADTPLPPSDPPMREQGDRP
jgi:carbon storage regulator CsrA